MSNRSRERLPSLDGLRAIAVALIVTAHAFTSRGLPDWLLDAGGAILKGGLGVQIFFTLSGFLITHVLLEEKDRRGGLDIRHFYARRLCRICPAHYTYLAALATLAVAGLISISAKSLIASALYIVNYQRAWQPDDGAGYWFVGHLWTLCIEQQFYLLWPLAIARCNTKNLLRLTIALILAMPLLRVAHYFLFPSVRAQLGLFFHTGADCIFVGALAAILLREPWNLRAQIGARSAIFPALAAAWLIWGVPFSREQFGGWWNIGPARAAIAVSVVILAFWFTVHPESRFGKILNSRPILYLASISYGLFLWQQLLLFNANSQPLLFVFLRIAAAILIAIASYELVEKSVGNWARRKFARATRLDSEPVAP